MHTQQRKADAAAAAANKDLAAAERRSQQQGQAAATAMAAAASSSFSNAKLQSELHTSHKAAGAATAANAALQQSLESTRTALDTHKEKCKTAEQLADSLKAAHVASQQEVQAMQDTLACLNSNLSSMRKAMRSQEQKAAAAAQKKLVAAQQRSQQQSQASARALAAAASSSFQIAKLKSKIRTLQQLVSSNKAARAATDSVDHKQDCGACSFDMCDWSRPSSTAGSLARTTGSSGSSYSLMSASSGLQLSCSSASSMSSRLGSNLSALWQVKVLEGRATAACSTEGCSRSSSFTRVRTCSCQCALDDSADSSSKHPGVIGCSECGACWLW
jgi:hypothetical protein